MILSRLLYCLVHLCKDLPVSLDPCTMSHLAAINACTLQKLLQRLAPLI